MTHEPSNEPHDGPILLCAGTDPAMAVHLAEVAASLCNDRPVVVLATWATSPIMGPLDGVMDALYDTHADLRVAQHDAAAQAARAASDVLDADGFNVRRQVRPEELTPWQAILDVADEIDAGLIVVGTNEHETPRPGTIGRQARALAHRARRPLLFVPPGVPPAPEGAPVVFAYDGSAPAGHALERASALLRRRPAIVASAWRTASYAVGVALLAVPDEVARTGADRLDEAAGRRALRQAQEAAGQLTADRWSCAGVALQTPHNAATAILDAADEHDAALIVTGTRGRSRVAATVLGSTAEAVLRHAGRPTLLVPPAGS